MIIIEGRTRWNEIKLRLSQLSQLGALTKPQWEECVALKEEALEISEQVILLGEIIISTLEVIEEMMWQTGAALTDMED